MAMRVNPHLLRAFVLAFGLACFGAAGPLAAGTLLSPGTASLIKKSAEPFGLPTALLPDGGLRDKWQRVQRRLEDELVQLALCEGDRERCASPAALQFLAIVEAGKLRDGRARLGEVNRAINLAVRPVSDMAQYGETDVWTTPLVTLARGGDCEDYAIAKFVALRLAGVAADDLRIVIMRDTVHGTDHAVATARLDGRWLTLDNRRMTLVEDSDVRNARALIVIDQHNIMRTIDAPVLADASRRVVPAGLLAPVAD